MFLHRNSQKRIYFADAIYFVTVCVHDRLPFFEKTIFCDLFIEELKLTKILKDFKLFGFVILPDHFHLLVQPGDKYNISEIMRSLKTNSSRNINNIINHPEGAVTSPRLRGIGFNHIKNNLPTYQNKFIQKFGPNQFAYPKFQWQKSYYDHVIRNESDFNFHLQYIWYNPLKHNLANNFANYQYSSYNDNYQGLIDYL